MLPALIAITFAAPLVWDAARLALGAAAHARRAAAVASHPLAPRAGMTPSTPSSASPPGTPDGGGTTPASPTPPPPVAPQAARSLTPAAVPVLAIVAARAYQTLAEARIAAGDLAAAVEAYDLALDAGCEDGDVIARLLCGRAAATLKLHAARAAPPRALADALADCNAALAAHSPVKASFYMVRAKVASAAHAFGLAAADIEAATAAVGTEIDGAKRLVDNLRMQAMMYNAYYEWPKQATAGLVRALTG